MLHNFREISSTRLFENFHHCTKGSTELAFPLLELSKTQAAHIHIRAVAFPPGQKDKFPPKFQSLEADEIAYVHEGSVHLLSHSKHLESVLKPPKLWGTNLVFPVKATLRCQNMRILLELFGESQDFDWSINLQGALYNGSYESNTTS